MLVYGVMKLWLFPSQTNLTSSDFLQGDLWWWWNVEAQFLNENIIRSLTDLPCSVEKPAECQISKTKHSSNVVSEESSAGKWGLPDQRPQN